MKLFNAYVRYSFTAILFFTALSLCAEEQTVKESAAEKWARLWVSIQNYWLYTPDSSSRRETPRGFELGASVTAAFGWDLYLGFFDLFKKNKTVTIDFNKVVDNLSMANPKGAHISAELQYQFLYMKFYRKANSAFSFSFMDITGYIDTNFSEDLFVFFAKGNQEKYNIEPSVTVSGALFAEILSFEWQQRIFSNYYITIKPSWYIPILYIPKSVQKLKVSAEENFVAELNGGINMYIPFSMEDGFKITNLGGVDADISVERPIFNILDAGLTIKHIPLMPSVLSNAGEIGLEGKAIDTSGGVENLKIKIPELEQFYHTKNFWVFRPVRIEVYGFYRPFGNDFFMIHPVLGVSFLNPSEELYINPRIEISVSPLDFLCARFSTGMDNNMAKNSLNVTFNWRQFGFFIEMDIRSHDYLRSWTLKGAGLSMGWYAGF